MIPAPVPPDERERLEALRRLAVLDTEPDAVLDQLAALASRLCGMPIALVSLVDEKRQWFKSRVGLESRETPREVSLCAHAILAPDQLFEVEDATLDARFQDNPLVTGEPHLRHYAAAPLLSAEGAALGTLCVIGNKPGRLDGGQRAALTGLAQIVSRQLSLYQATRDLRETLGATEKMRRQLEAQRAVLQVLADERSPSAAAPSIARAIGLALGFDGCSVWVAAPRGDHLLCAGAWCRDEQGAPFRDDTVARVFALGEGLPGRILASGKSAVIEALAADAGFPRRQVAAACGLQSGFGAPMLGDAGVLGVLEVFNRTAGPPGDEVLRTLETLGHQVGLAVQRERAEAHAHSTDARTRAIVASALDCVIAIDGQGCVTEFNPASERTFGWSRAEALGRALGDLIIPERMRAAHAAGLRRYLTTGEARVVGTRLELSAVRRDGTEFPVELALSRTPGPGPFEVTAFLRDITARVQADAELRKSRDEAEAANRAKSEFLANASHEIRTPMNAILGMTELALENSVDPDQRELLGTVHANAESLLGLVNEILDEAKISSGQVEIVNRPCDVAEVMESVAEAMSVRAHKARLQLVCDVGDTLPPALRTDAQRLRQVLLNLVGNAVKFTVEGRVELGVHAEQTAPNVFDVHFEVRDTGVGIPSDALERVFERFFQVDRSASRPGSGTGLGLGITRRLVNAMGGRVWAESALGRGSTFHVVVPMQRADPAEEAAPEAGPPAGSLQPDSTRLVLVGPPGPDRAAVLNALARSALAIQRVDDAAALGGLPLRGDEVFLLDETLGPAGQERAAEWLAARGWSARAVCLGGTGTAPAGAETLRRPITRRRVREAVGRVLAPRATPASAGSAPATGSASVLLVDDHVDNLTFGSRALERDGHRVQVAQSGAEALALLRTQHFDLVLTDLEMPGMDGYTLARALRAEARGGVRTPIVALTAHAGERVRARCVEAGMDDCVTKPVRGEVLRSKVREHCNLLPAAATPPLDLSTGAQLAERAPVVLVDDDIADLVPGYLAARAQDVVRLWSQLRSGDFAAVAELGHKLAGSGTAYGFPLISELGQRLEAAGRREARQSAERAIEALDAYLRSLQWAPAGGPGSPPP